MDKEYQKKMLHGLQLILLANGIAHESVSVLLIIFSTCPEKILDWARKLEEMGIVVDQDHIAQLVTEAIKITSND